MRFMQDQRTGLLLPNRRVQRGFFAMGPGFFKQPVSGGGSPTFVGWQTMTPDDPTDFHTTVRSTVTYQAGDLLLMAGFGYADSGIVISDSGSHTWNKVTGTSKFVNDAGWNTTSTLLWYCIPGAAGSMTAIADGSAGSLYVGGGGWSLAQFRAPSGNAWSYDTGILGQTGYATSGSVSITTAGKGLLFFRDVGNEDTATQTFACDKVDNVMGKTNSQQSWSGSTTENAGWAGYTFKTAAVSALACGFTVTVSTYQGMAVDSFTYG